MDLDRSVTYRSFDLNDADVDTSGRIRGCQLHSVDYSTVDTTGYMERRANSDGLVANDIFLGIRRIALVGTVYGETRAEAHDRFQDLCAALNPRLAYKADPGAKGFLPLAFDIPTADTADDEFPSGWRSVHIHARSVGLPQARFTRDTSAGEHFRGLGIPWAVNMQAIDPRIYVATPYIHHIPTNFGGGNSGPINVINRGDYDAPLNMTLFIPSDRAAGDFWWGGGGSHGKITIPNESVDQTLRFDGDNRILTQTKGGVETLRQDLLYFDVENTVVAVPPGGDTWSYELTSAGCTIGAGSSIWFNEAFT